MDHSDAGNLKEELMLHHRVRDGEMKATYLGGVAYWGNRKVKVRSNRVRWQSKDQVSEGGGREERRWFVLAAVSHGISIMHDAVAASIGCTSVSLKAVISLRGQSMGNQDLQPLRSRHCLWWSVLACCRPHLHWCAVVQPQKEIVVASILKISDVNEWHSTIGTRLDEASLKIMCLHKSSFENATS
ncbi:unnamed protein product [Hydatigera taeniaeformis]|uniref:Uncharacterized protein n=1 Tax=Hydatigena taeniaeformis TaxID=6205 RepID=A0A0R3X8Q8_HYDTA|nr:unnamed protein product [Hydatigera taeniaeformis]